MSITVSVVLLRRHDCLYTFSFLFHNRNSQMFRIDDNFFFTLGTKERIVLQNRVWEQFQSSFSFAQRTGYPIGFHKLLLRILHRMYGWLIQLSGFDVYKHGYKIMSQHFDDLLFGKITHTGSAQCTDAKSMNPYMFK